MQFGSMEFITNTNKTKDQLILEGLQSVIEMCMPNNSFNEEEVMCPIKKVEVANCIEKKFPCLEKQLENTEEVSKNTGIEDSQRSPNYNGDVVERTILIDTEVDSGHSILGVKLTPISSFVRSRKFVPERSRLHPICSRNLYSKYSQTVAFKDSQIVQCKSQESQTSPQILSTLTKHTSTVDIVLVQNNNYSRNMDAQKIMDPFEFSSSSNLDSNTTNGMSSLKSYETKTQKTYVEENVKSPFINPNVRYICARCGAEFTSLGSDTLTPASQKSLETDIELNKQNCYQYLGNQETGVDGTYKATPTKELECAIVISQLSPNRPISKDTFTQTNTVLSKTKIRCPVNNSKTKSTIPILVENRNRDKSFRLNNTAGNKFSSNQNKLYPSMFLAKENDVVYNEICTTIKSDVSKDIGTNQNYFEEEQVLLEKSIHERSYQQGEIENNCYQEKKEKINKNYRELSSNEKNIGYAEYFHPPNLKSADACNIIRNGTSCHRKIWNHDEQKEKNVLKHSILSSRQSEETNTNNAIFKAPSCETVIIAHRSSLKTLNVDVPSGIIRQRNYRCRNRLVRNKDCKLQDIYCNYFTKNVKTISAKEDKTCCQNFFHSLNGFFANNLKKTSFHNTLKPLKYFSKKSSSDKGSISEYATRIISFSKVTEKEKFNNKIKQPNTLQIKRNINSSYYTGQPHLPLIPIDVNQNGINCKNQKQRNNLTCSCRYQPESAKPMSRKTKNCCALRAGEYEAECNKPTPKEIRYATTKISKFDQYSTFEIFKSSECKPNCLSSETENIFVMKNKNI
ncbi:hypothetical protein FQA39_LY10435 [Lamprigera yunnana]|nr:hypothetical protein FQA39_LY10435 [Lamprigera yunnana]